MEQKQKLFLDGHPLVGASIPGLPPHELKVVAKNRLAKQRHTE